MFGAKFIILCDEKLADDLLRKKASNYSDKADFKAVVDSTSTHGSMEYLALMGNNGKIFLPFCSSRVLI